MASATRDDEERRRLRARARIPEAQARLQRLEEEILHHLALPSGHQLDEQRLPALGAVATGRLLRERPRSLRPPSRRTVSKMPSAASPPPRPPPPSSPSRSTPSEPKKEEARLRRRLAQKLALLDPWGVLQNYLFVIEVDLRSSDAPLPLLDLATRLKPPGNAKSYQDLMRRGGSAPEGGGAATATLAAAAQTRFICDLLHDAEGFLRKVWGLRPASSARAATLVRLLRRAPYSVEKALAAAVLRSPDRLLFAEVDRLVEDVTSSSKQARARLQDAQARALANLARAQRLHLTKDPKTIAPEPQNYEKACEAAWSLHLLLRAAASRRSEGARAVRRSLLHRRGQRELVGEGLLATARLWTHEGAPETQRGDAAAASPQPSPELPQVGVPEELPQGVLRRGPQGRRRPWREVEAELSRLARTSYIARTASSLNRGGRAGLGDDDVALLLLHCARVTVYRQDPRVLELPGRSTAYPRTWVPSPVLLGRLREAAADLEPPPRRLEEDEAARQHGTFRVAARRALPDLPAHVAAAFQARLDQLIDEVAGLSGSCEEALRGFCRASRGASRVAMLRELGAAPKRTAHGVARVSLTPGGAHDAVTRALREAFPVPFGQGDEEASLLADYAGGLVGDVWHVPVARDGRPLSQRLQERLPPSATSLQTWIQSLDADAGFVVTTRQAFAEVAVDAVALVPHLDHLLRVRLLPDRYPSGTKAAPDEDVLQLGRALCQGRCRATWLWRHVEGGSPEAWGTWLFHARPSEPAASEAEHAAAAAQLWAARSLFYLSPFAQEPRALSSASGAVRLFDRATLAPQPDRVLQEGLRSWRRAVTETLSVQPPEHAAELRAALLADGDDCTARLRWDAAASTTPPAPIVEATLWEAELQSVDDATGVVDVRGVLDEAVAASLRHLVRDETAFDELRSCLCADWRASLRFLRVPHREDEHGNVTVELRALALLPSCRRRLGSRVDAASFFDDARLLWTASPTDETGGEWRKRRAKAKSDARSVENFPAALHGFLTPGGLDVSYAGGDFFRRLLRAREREDLAEAASRVPPLTWLRQRPLLSPGEVDEAASDARAALRCATRLLQARDAAPSPPQAWAQLRLPLTQGGAGVVSCRFHRRPPTSSGHQPVDRSMLLELLRVDLLQRPQDFWRELDVAARSEAPFLFGYLSRHERRRFLRELVDAPAAMLQDQSRNVVEYWTRVQGAAPTPSPFVDFQAWSCALLAVVLRVVHDEAWLFHAAPRTATAESGRAEAGRRQAAKDERPHGDEAGPPDVNEVLEKFWRWKRLARSRKTEPGRVSATEVSEAQRGARGLAERWRWHARDGRDPAARRARAHATVMLKQLEQSDPDREHNLSQAAREGFFDDPCFPVGNAGERRWARETNQHWTEGST